MSRRHLVLLILWLTSWGLSACGGEAAVADLQKLTDNACGCTSGEFKDDPEAQASCTEDAKAEARQWVENHKDARGGDHELASKLTEKLKSCNYDVAKQLRDSLKEAGKL